MQQPQSVIIQEKERIIYRDRFWLNSANFWKGTLFGWLVLPWLVSAAVNGISDNSPLAPMRDIYVSATNLYNDVALGLKCRYREVSK
jgi:hypothetical protein